MDCAAVKPRMEALVSGSLPPDEKTMAEQHIAMCEGCRLELELVRAIGSQEKPPAEAGSKDDWTLNRIFGSEGGAAGAATPSASEAPEPASAEAASEAKSDSIFGPPDPPASMHPALVPDTGESEPEDSEAPSGRKPVEATWSFEPAEAASDVKPPEESLFFAAEALNRKAGGADAKKGSGARVILWSVGGLVGLGLLAFSAWFVLHMGPSSAADTSRLHAAPAPSGNGAPSTPAAPTTEPDVVPTPSPADGTIQDQGGQPPNDEVQTPAPDAAPQVSASTTPPEPMPLATTPAPKKPATTSTTTTSPAPHPSQVTLGPKTPSRGSQVPQTHPAPIPESSHSDAIDESDPEDSGSADATPTVTSPDVTSEPSTQPLRGSAMWSSRAPKAPPPAEAPAPAPPPADPSSPIERLHLATVAAQERDDLDALRRLKSSWKSFMGKIVGPDRARAKREYADCLWAIQNVTGRRADQKETLAAYRDYLLGAPAGGADSRTVMRLRQLEDAMAEPH